MPELLEICRQGLIGGNSGFVNGRDIKVSDHLATQLVRTYLHPEIGNPIMKAWDLAAAVIHACVQGYEPAAEKKPEAQEEDERFDRGQVIGNGVIMGLSPQEVLAMSIHDYQAAIYGAIFRGLNGRNVRHLFTTVTPSDYPGIPREITVDGFFCDQSAIAADGVTGGDAMDTHAPADGITFQNGTIKGASQAAINIECFRARLKSIDIYGAATAGVNIANYTDHDGDYSIDDVHVYSPGANGSGVQDGIRVLTVPGASGSIDRLQMTSCSVSDAPGVSYSVQGTPSLPIKAGDLTNLQSIRCRSSLAHFNLTDIKSGSMSQINSRDGTEVSASVLRGRNLENMSIMGLKGNLPTSATGRLVDLSTSSGTSKDISIDHVAGQSPSPASSTGIIIGSSVTGVKIGQNCSLDEFTTPINWGSGDGHRGGFITKTYTYDPASVAAGATAASNFTFSGAVAGRDVVDVTFSEGSSAIRWSAEVTGTNSIRVAHENIGGATVDLSSGILTLVQRRVR